MRKPFFRKARKCWYVKDDLGAFIRLDPDEGKAFAMWERMRRLSDFRHADATLEAIFEAFLGDLETKVKPYRLNCYISLLEAFALHFGPHRRARDVTGSDVIRWVRLKRTFGKESRQWSVARQRDAGQAVKRAIDWVVKRTYIPWSDVLELEFETPQPRDGLISYEDHAKLVKQCHKLKRSRPFALVLIALRHSGARPIQVREMTAANFVNDAWVFRSHKTSGKTRKPLIVRCGGCLHTLTRILVHHRPKGPLFLSAEGTAWPKDGIVLRFKRLRESVKLEGISAYSYRHTYATDALQAGIPIATVAALLGHTNSAMVSKVYGHLEKRVDHVTQAAITMRRENNGNG